MLKIRIKDLLQSAQQQLAQAFFIRGRAVHGEQAQLLGRVKLLAVTSVKRTALLPDVPTLDESGLKGFDTSIWYGFFAPKNTPLEVRKAIADALMASNEEPDVRKVLSANGADPMKITIDDLSAFVRADAMKWKGVVEAARISVR